MHNILAPYLPVKKQITAKANAKINLSLAVTGTREDGYHTVDTVMQSVALADKITVKKADHITVACSDTSLSGEDNIAHRAALLFFETAGIPAGAHIYINKRIPAAAGLGGGSADAAAVLLALNKLYKTGLDDKTLCRIALRLGADVPFFIRGGTARAEGIGEILTPLKPLKKGCFLIAKSGEKPSTKEMYRRLDSMPCPAVNTNEMIACCEKGDLTGIAKATGNSFSVLWQDSLLAKQLWEFSPIGVGLSGSGPSFFAIFQSGREAKKAAKHLKKEGIAAFAAYPSDCGILLGK